MTREFTSPLSTSVDKGWAWMIVVGVSLQLFCFIGIGKSMGLIAMELVRKFDVAMATAILPATVLFSTFAIASPVAVIAGEIFSIQAVVIFGSLFGFICISLASLLFSVMYYILFVGIGMGVGGACYYGNGFILLSRYFQRHRSLANGLSFAGASMGHFVWPPIIEYLLDEYGLAGTTLIISAIFLQGAISGSLFRPIGEVHEDNDVSVMADDNGTVQNISELKSPVHTKADVSSTPPDCPVSVHDPLLRFDLQSGDNNDQTSCIASQTTAGLQIAAQGKIALNNMTISDTNESFDSRAVNVSQLQNNKELMPNSQTRQFLQKLSKAMDFTVLKNYITLYYTAVALLSFFGYMNIVLFFPAIFMEKGISIQDSAILVLVSGGGDIVSRVGMGFLADKNLLPRYILMALACCFTGLDIFVLYFVDNFWWAAVHCFLYGISGGTYVCLVAVVLVDLVGLAELNRNMVVVLLVEGVGSGLGQPFLGALKDATGSCDIVIILCSFASLMGGLLELSYPLVRRLENRRLARRQACS